MNKSIFYLLTAFISVTFLSLPAFSEDMSHKGHDHGKMESKGETHQMEHQLEHSGRMGKMIHEAKVEGYKFMYHLIDVSEHMKEMKKTHHLMVYISSPDNHTVNNAKVGYLITGPDGSKQKTMAMGMSGGFGADINLQAKGTYTIATKAKMNERQLIDKFKYTMD